MEITPILANSNPSALLLMIHDDHVLSYILCWVIKCKPLITKCCTFCLEDLLFKLWLRLFILGFWLELLLRVPWRQRKRNLIVCWSSYLKVYRFDFVGRLHIKVFMNREQALRVSPLKQSTGLSKKWRSTLFSISSDMLLQLNLSAYDKYVRTDSLTSRPFTPCRPSIQR